MQRICTVSKFAKPPKDGYVPCTGMGIDDELYKMATYGDRRDRNCDRFFPVLHALS
jgi:hypothetical protein